MNAIEQEVLDAIRANVDPVHTREISDFTALDRTDVTRAVYELRKKGLIYQDGEAKLPGRGGRNVALYSPCDIDAALAEAIRAAEDPADPEAAMDEPTMPTETYEDEAPQAVQVSEYEQANEEPQMEDDAAIAEDPLTRAMNRLRIWSPISDGRARAARLRALAEKIGTVSVDVAADLLETATIIEEMGE